jgi:hypothetical protein
MLQFKKIGLAGKITLITSILGALFTATLMILPYNCTVFNENLCPTSINYINPVLFILFVFGLFLVAIFGIIKLVQLIKRFKEGKPIEISPIKILIASIILSVVITTYSAFNVLVPACPSPPLSPILAHNGIDAVYGGYPLAWINHEWTYGCGGWPDTAPLAYNLIYLITDIVLWFFAVMIALLAGKYLQAHIHKK